MTANERVEAAARGAFGWDDCYLMPWEDLDDGTRDWYRSLAAEALKGADAHANQDEAHALAVGAIEALRQLTDAIDWARAHDMGQFDPTFLDAAKAALALIAAYDEETRQ